MSIKATSLQASTPGDILFQNLPMQHLMMSGVYNQAIKNSTSGPATALAIATRDLRSITPEQNRTPGDVLYGRLREAFTLNRISGQKDREHTTLADKAVTIIHDYEQTEEQRSDGQAFDDAAFVESN